MKKKKQVAPKKAHPISRQEMKEMFGEQTKIILATTRKETEAMFGEQTKIILATTRKETEAMFGEHRKEVKDMFGDQAKIILTAVDKRFDLMDLKLSEQSARIDALEEKFDRKFNQLITTLDGFVKRMTDVETEYEMMKVDINRIKVVVKEKLGVDLL